MKLLGGISIFLFLGAGAFGAGYFTMSMIAPKAEVAIVSPVPLPQEQVVAPAEAAPVMETTEASSTAEASDPKPTSTKASFGEDEEFVEKLSSCTPYKKSFTHALTGVSLEKEILGMIGERCGYTELMPDGKKMECAYSESELKAIVEYYKDIAAAESLGFPFEGKTAKYTVEGKKVANPLEEVMLNESCGIP